MNEDQSHILLVDGVCNLCNGIVTFTIKRDIQNKFRFVFLQSERGQTLLKQFGLPTNDLATFVYIIGDKYYLKSSAGLRVLKELGGFWKLAYVFMILPTPFRDFIYNVISKSRYTLFGKRDSCMIPTPELKSRFLS